MMDEQMFGLDYRGAELKSEEEESGYGCVKKGMKRSSVLTEVTEFSRERNKRRKSRNKGGWREEGSAGPLGFE